MCVCVDEIKAKGKKNTIVKYESAAFWSQTMKYVPSGTSHHIAGCIMHVKIIYYVVKMKDGRRARDEGEGGQPLHAH